MVLRFDDYQDHKGLLDKIRYINKAYYEPVAKNLIYLEKHANPFFIHAIALRDAYSHLVRIIDYEDIASADNKIKIVRQLERYLGHLEELLYDTYLKIIKNKADELFKCLKDSDKPSIKMKLALKLKEVRTVDDSIDIEKKKEKFNDIIKFIEDVYNMHQS